MRIMGYFDDHFEPSAPFVRVVKSETLGLSYPLGVHIDTGSSVTIIFDRDVELLGIDVGKLKRAERNVGGIGHRLHDFQLCHTRFLLCPKLES